MPQASSFKAALTNGDETNGMVLVAVKHMSEDKKGRVLTAVKTLLTLPWDEWVKLYTTCHHCREGGHIRSNCPKYILALKSSKISPKNPRKFHDMYKKSPGHQLPGKPGYRKQPPQNFKDPKAKAFLSAFQASSHALFANEEVSDDNNDEENKDNTSEDDCDVYDDVNDLYGFLIMVGSSKE